MRERLGDNPANTAGQLRPGRCFALRAWAEEGLELEEGFPVRAQTYLILAIGADRGLVEIVPHSTTLEVTGGTKGTETAAVPRRSYTRASFRGQDSRAGDK